MEGQGHLRLPLAANGCPVGYVVAYCLSGGTWAMVVDAPFAGCAWVRGAAVPLRSMRAMRGRCAEKHGLCTILRVPRRAAVLDCPLLNARAVAGQLDSWFLFLSLESRAMEASRFEGRCCCVLFCPPQCRSVWHAAEKYGTQAVLCVPQCAGHLAFAKRCSERGRPQGGLRFVVWLWRGDVCDLTLLLPFATRMAQIALLRRKFRFVVFRNRSLRCAGGGSFVAGAGSAAMQASSTPQPQEAVDSLRMPMRACACSAEKCCVYCMCWGTKLMRVCNGYEFLLALGGRCVRADRVARRMRIFRPIRR